MKETDNPIANPIVILREEFDDWAVLFHPDTAEALGINPVGVTIWKLLDGHHGPVEIEAAIKEQFSEVPDSLSEDVTAFLNQLSQGGFVGYELQNAEA